MNFGDCPSHFPSIVSCGEVSQSVYDHAELLIITGSSSNHFYPNINCMYTILLYDIQTSIVFVDYGISERELKNLGNTFESINKLYKQYNSTAQLYYRKFNFANFPAFFNIHSLSVGGYSWKVVSYTDVLEECQGPLLWTDAGTLLNPSMFKEIEYMKENGIYSPSSPGTIGDWVYPRSIQFMKQHKLIEKVDKKKSMCTGGYLFMDGKNQTILKRIIYPLLQCAYTEKCIVPKPSTRLDHRQDQAILTLLIHNMNIQKSCDDNYTIIPAFRRDCMDLRSCRKIRSVILSNITAKYSLVSI